MCEFEPVIMMLAGNFAHQLMQFLHSVIGLCILICFCSGWYQFFFSIFSASFRSPARQAGGDEIPWHFLSRKDFISPLLMRLSWLDMKFWVESSFFKKC